MHVVPAGLMRYHQPTVDYVVRCTCCPTGPGTSGRAIGTSAPAADRAEKVLRPWTADGDEPPAPLRRPTHEAHGRGDRSPRGGGRRGRVLRRGGPCRGHSPGHAHPLAPPRARCASRAVAPVVRAEMAVRYSTASRFGLDPLPWTPNPCGRRSPRSPPTRTGRRSPHAVRDGVW